jgi:arsenate reductase (thioredoxin)
MKIVFLCVANSARSQMAEALARRVFGPDVEITSAGSKPTFVHPMAIQVLEELGIDHTPATSKGTEAIDWQNVDFVVTLCADEVCPVHVGTGKRLHWPFRDPAGAGSSAAEALALFRAVRDQIAAQLEEWHRNFSE